MANPFDQFDVATKAGNPFDQFDAPAKRERTFGEAAKDIGAGLVSGAGALTQLPGQLYGLATGDFSDTGLTKVGREIREAGEGMKSEELKRREAERAAKIKEAGKEGEFKAGVTAFMETIKDPALLSNFIAEQAPNLLPGLAVARGLSIAGAGARTAVSGAVGTGAVQQGADIGAGTYEQLYKEMIGKGVPEEEAAGRALGYARATGAGAAVISLLAQRLPGGRAIEEAMAKVPVKGGRFGAAVKGGAGETISEMIEEGGGKVAQNLAGQQVDPNRSITEGLGETMGMAAVGGLGLGTAAGLTRGREAPPPEAAPPEEPAVEPAAAPVEQPLVATLPGAETVTPPEAAIAEQELRARAEAPPIPEAEFVQEEPAPRPPELAEMEQDMEALGKEAKRLERGEPGKSLWSAVKGNLTPTDFSELDDKKFRMLLAPKGTRGVSIADLTASGQLNDWLPEQYHGSPDQLEFGRLEGDELGKAKDAEEYIKDQLRQGNYLTYATNMRLKQIGVELSNIEDAYREYADAETFNTLIQEALDEQRAVYEDFTGAPTEAETGVTEPPARVLEQIPEERVEEEYFPDQEEARGRLAEEASGLPDPELRIDNPGGDWLEGKRRYSLKEGVNEFGVPTNWGATTGVYKRSVLVPVDLLAQVPGMRGEQQNVRPRDLASIKNYMEEKNKLPPARKDEDEKHYYPFIMVYQDGKPYVNEGNHRIMAAKELGYKYLPVELRYYNGGEEIGGAFSPEKLLEYDRQARAEGYDTKNYSEATKGRAAEKAKLVINKDPEFERIEKELTGKTLLQVSKWAVDNAPNKFAKAIAQKVLNRLNGMASRGIKLEFDIAGGGNRPLIMRNARGITDYTFGKKGEPGTASIKITLNGAPVVDNQAGYPPGTRYITVLHELLHAATVGQVNVLKGDDPLVRELRDLFNKVVTHFNTEVRAGRLTPFMEKMYAREINALTGPDELIAWGIADQDMQQFLSEIKVGEQTIMDKLVELIRKILNVTKPYLTALDQLVKTTESILDEDVNVVGEKIIAKQYSFGVKPGEQPMQGTLFQEQRNVKTPEFRKWFGKSKVVDQDGKPIRLYHSTYSDIKVPTTNFGADEYRRFGMHVGSLEAATNRLDVKAAEDARQREASGTAGANILPVYVKAESPLRLDENRTGRWGVDDIMRQIIETAERGEIEGLTDEDIDAWYNDTFDIENWLGLTPDVGSREYDPDREERFWSDTESYFPGERSKLLNAFIRQLGYDSIVYRNEFEGGGDSYLLLDPNQIKSVFNERPTEAAGILQEQAGAPKTPAQKARAAAQKALQKRTLKKSQFDGVPDDLYSALEPVFAPEKKTIIDKIDGMRDGFFMKLAQGVADQYRSIKDISEEAYMKARMSKTIDGALEGILFNGQVKLTDGALDIAPKTKGLLKVLEPVGNEVDRYQIWVALQRDAQLVAQGKAPSVNRDIVARRAELAAGKIGNKSRLEVYKQVQKDMNELNRSVLRIAYKQGIIDKEAFKVYSRDINYIPFYKVMDENGDVQGAATKSGLINQYFSKALKGGEKPFGDLMENTLRNWSHILSASMKNEAANATVRAAMDLGGAYPNLKVGLEWRDGKVYSSKSGELVNDGKLKPEFTTSGKGMIKTMIDGKPAYFDIVDPMLLESIMSIGYMGPKSKFLDLARDFKNMLQFGVTLSPAFKVRNLFRDSISAIAVTDLKKNPFANVIQGWTESDRNNPAHISALAGGAIFNFGSAYEGDQAKLIKRLLDSGVKGENILDNEKKIQAGIGKAWRAYQEWGNKSESTNRMALYKQLKEQGYSHLEASFYARDMLDFSMQGSWPAFRLVTQVVPFLNARVQGLYKLGRDGVIPTSRVIYNTVTGKPIEATDKQRAEQFSVVMGAVVLASLMLYMAFKDDEEYKKREQWDRDNFWWFKLPGMDTAIRVPKPFEIGAMGTLAERVVEQIVDQGAEGKVFGQSLSRMLTDTFAINPIPQIIKPLVDLYANKDSFTGAPIETAGMERLSKAERIAERTSPLAIGLSKVANVFLPEATEVSPVQVDYAIKGYLGWLGGTISATSHYAVMPFSKSAYPDANWTETMSMGFIKTLPATQSKYVTAFYENNKEISQAYADMRHFAQLGQADKVQEILAEKGDKIAMAKFYDNASKDMAKMRQVVQAIRNDETMTGAQKKEEIDRIKILIGELAQQMEEARIEVKKSYAGAR